MQRQDVPHRLAAFVLIVLVLAVNGAYYLHARRTPDIGQDFDQQYSLIAEHIVRDGAYSRGERDAMGQLRATATLPPLFVLLYAASFAIFGFGVAAHEAIHVLFVLANMGTILVSWRIGHHFSRRIGYAVAAFAVVDGTALFFTQNYGIPDSLLGFWMALMVLYLVKFFHEEPSCRNIFLGTLFLGLGMWTKVAPYMLWVPFAVLLAFFLWRTRGIPLERKGKIFGVFALTVLLFFGGWKVRNSFAIGYGNFTTVGATAYRWNASQLLAYQEGITRAEASAQLAQRYTTEEALSLNEGARNRYLSRAFVPLLLRSPIAFSYVTLRALPGFFLGTFPPYVFLGAEDAQVFKDRVVAAQGSRSILGAAWREGFPSFVAFYLLAKLHLVLLYGAAAVAVVAFLRRRALWWVLALFVLTVLYVIIVSGAATQARYRTMIMPIVYVLGGVGVAYLWERLRRRRASSRGGTTGTRTIVFP